MDVEQPGAAGVGIVGAVHPFPSEIPQQPAVHRAAAQGSGVGRGAHRRQMFQHPGQFGGAEIGRKGQSSFLPDHRVGTGQPGAEVLGPAALPDNGVIEGCAGGFIPGQHRFPLVGKAHRRQVRRVHPGFSQGGAGHGQGVLQYFPGIVFHPAAGVDLLGMGPVRPAHQGSFAVKDHALGALGALVNGQNVRFHRISSRAAAAMPAASRP